MIVLDVRRTSPPPAQPAATRKGAPVSGVRRFSSREARAYVHIHTIQTMEVLLDFYVIAP